MSVAVSKSVTVDSENGMAGIEMLFSGLRHCYEKDEAIDLLRTLTAYIADGSVKLAEKNKAWALVELVRSHARFTDWDKAAVIALLEAVARSPSFSAKQRGKAQVPVLRFAVNIFL